MKKKKDVEERKRSIKTLTLVHTVHVDNSSTYMVDFQPLLLHVIEFRHG